MEKQWAVGVDLGGTKIEAAAISEEGEVLEKARTPTNVEGGAEAIVQQISDLSKELMDKVDGRPIGLGVGVAGQIDPKSGTVLSAPNLHWDHFPFKEKLEESLSLLTKITNDVKAAALGEALFGAAKGADTVVCVFIGTGIGGGIVEKGHLIDGASNVAGEVGHMRIRESGIPCSCGHLGCWESYGGGWAIAAHAQEALTLKKESLMLHLADGVVERVTAREVIEAFRQNDALASEVIRMAERSYIDGFINLTHTLNPDLFVIGGGIADALPELVSIIEQGVKEKVLPAAKANLSFKKTALTKDSGVVGAASLLFSK